MTNASYPLVDKLSPIPAYQQIATDLISRIESEEWPVGYKLPNQNKLSECYGVALVTMRQALAILENNGFIVRKQGRGAFVTGTPKLFTHNILPPSFATEIEQQAGSVVHKDVRIELIKTYDKIVKQKLNIEYDEPVVYIQRLFEVNSVTIGLGRSWIPAHLVPGLETTGLIDNRISKTIFLKYSLDVVDIENIVESIRVNAYEASLLAASYDDAALRIDSVHYLKDGGVVEFARNIWLSRYTRLQFKVSK